MIRALLCGLTAVAVAGLAAGCDREPERPPPPVGVEVGSTAPPLSGRLASGEAFSLGEGEDSAQVVVFYRRGGCGLCRIRLEQLQEHLEEYRALGASVVAVTADAPAETERTSRLLRLSFPVVSVDTTVLSRWAVVDTARGMALPATFLLDTRGVIRFRHVGRNAADRASDAGVLVALQRLEGEG